MPTHDIIVIGASAGGVEALMQLVKELPPHFPASIFIVLHVPAKGTSLLPQILARASSLPALHPQSGDIIEKGKIYIAPNNHHLLIEDGHVALSTGPRENGFRPSVDALFRTAAKAYRAQVVGVILTGLLDNGCAGLVSIKEHGGIAIIQDPEDAQFPAMPQNALRVVIPDYVLPLAKIPEKLVEMAKTAVPVLQPAGNPGHDTAETGEYDSVYNQIEGIVTDLVCPDCGGVLVEFTGGKNGQLVN
jgi:two-component system chemotaxis response regulator CheB